MIDMTGKVVGNLTVLYKHSSKNGAVWSCQCACGNQTTAYGNTLRRGKKTSCGCRSAKTHGLSRSPEYLAWQSMLQRCLNANHRYYKDYGGRGIKVCARWMKFENFLADMGERPSSKHSLDRKNNSQGYLSSNCRWADPIEQQNNKRTSRKLTYDGKTLTVAQWSAEVGIRHSALTARLRRGWSIKKALETPLR